MKRFLVTALVPLLCAALPAAMGPAIGTASGTESASAHLTEGLSEEEAVELALRGNPELRAFRKQRDVAEGQIIIATALQNPELELQAVHAQQGAAMGWGAALKWTPPQPVAWSARRSLAQSHVAEVRYQIAEQEWALTTQVRMTHATLLQLREQEHIQEESVALRHRLIALIHTQVGRGQATRLELNLAELSLLSVQRNQDDIDLRNVQVQTDLQRLLGVVASDRINAKGNLTAEIEDVALPEPTLMTERALSTRPQLKAALAQLTQREQAIRIEKTKRWPWIELGARYRENSYSNYPHDLQLQLGLTLPILNTNAGAIQVARAQKEQQELTLQAQAQALTQSVHAACAELKVRKKILQRYRREVLPVLLEHERLMDAAARGAQVDLVALLSSEESVLRGRREYSDARLAYRRAWLTLEGAVGTPVWEVVR